MWLSGSVSGTTVTISVSANTGAARTGYLDITDTGSGQTVRITIKQSAKPTPTPTPKMSASKTTLTFDYAASSQSITISNSKGTLRADRNTDSMWLSGNVNGTSVTISVTTNTGAVRTGYLDITDTGSGQTVRITIKQSAKPTPTPTTKMTASKTSLTFDYAASSQTVTISNSKGTLRADRNTDSMWLSGSVNGTSVTISVTTNTGAARTGYLDITDTGSGQTVRITVKQNVKPTSTPTPKMTASKTNLSFDHLSGNQSITISNSKGTLRADRNTDSMWLSGSVNGTSVTVSVTYNSEYKPRTGYLDITDTGSGQTVRITVTQSAKPTPTPSPKMTASKTTLNFTYASSSQSITISNSKGTLRADRNTDSMWLSGSVNGNSVTIEVTNNKNYSSRTGYLDITDTGSGQTVRITVIQGAAPTPTPTKPLKADPSSLSFTREKSSKPVTLLNVDGTSTIRVDKNQDAVGWVIVSGSGSSYTITALENKTGELRKGTITFTDTSNGRHVDVVIHQSNIVFCNISFDVTEGPKEQQQHMQTQTVEQGGSLKGILPTSLVAPAFKQFDGWYDQRVGGTPYTENSRAPYKENITLYAHWVYKNYTIVYDGNGADNGMMKNTPATYGEWVLLSANKYIKTGKVFDGWVERVTGKKYKDQESVKNVGSGYSATVTLVAQWADPVYVTVTFDVNGGNESSLTTKKKTVTYSLEYGELPTDLTHPDGMIFEGWRTADGMPITKSTKVNTKSNHTLYAKWRYPEYTIHFDGNGCISGTMSDMTCKYGEEIKLPACAFDDGVMFDCWGTKKDGSGDNYKAKTYINLLGIDYSKKEITLYAQWKEKLYTVEYYDGFTGKLLHKDYKEDVLHKYMPMNAPEVEGLKFYGWSSEPVVAGYPLVENYSPKDIVFLAGQPTIVRKSLRVYAVYEKINTDDKIPVIFNLMGGKGGPKTMYVDRPATSATYPLPTPTPTKDRYQFDGWCTDMTTFSNQIVSKIEVNNWNDCIVLYARWVDMWTNVKLDYGYGNKVENVPISPDNPYYTFEEPSWLYDRDDYVLTGWKTADGVIHKVGEKIEVPLGGITATAQWERRRYNITYVDSVTGKVLKTQSLRSFDTIIPDTYDIVGKTFVGWICDYNPDGKTIAPGSLVSDFVDIHSKKRTDYKLTTYYVLDNSPHKGFIVCYNLNATNASGGPTQPTYGDSGTGEVVLSTEEPTRPGCYFRGWSRWQNGEPEGKGGDTIDCSNREYSDHIDLYAIWGSSYSCILDCNGVTTKNIRTYSITDAMPGDEIELSKYKKIFGIPKGYALLGWGITPDEISYAFDGTYTIPFCNVRLYAIWAKPEYTLCLIDGFSGQEIYRKTVIEKQTIKIPDVAPDIPGYKFRGWTVRFSYEDEPRYKRDDYIYLGEDIDLVSVYERLPADQYNFTIAYLPNGGEGGPGLVYYEPGEVQLSTEEPTRDGWTFLGWSYQNQNETFCDVAQFPKGKVNKVTGTSGEKLDLYAVWYKNNSSRLKDELEEEYGAKAIKDEFFEKKYESSDWEYINDRAYYVVRTWDRRNSLLCTSLESTVMIMEYKNGKWLLRAKGTSEGVWERIRLDILTSKTNTAAEVLDTVFKVVNTAAEIGISMVSVYCPAVGVVVSGLHYLNKAAECARTMDDYEYFEDWVLETVYDVVTDELKSRVKGKIDGELLGKALKIANETTGLNEKAGKYFVKLFKTTEKALRTEIVSNSDHMDPFGNYDKAITLFKKRVHDQKFNQTIEDNVPKIVDKIYQHVTY